MAVTRNSKAKAKRSAPAKTGPRTRSQAQQLGCMQVTLPVRGKGMTTTKAGVTKTKTKTKTEKLAIVKKPTAKNPALKKEPQKKQKIIILSVPTLYECQCCFTSLPSKSVTHCPSSSSHIICHTCLSHHARSQIGLLRHSIHCICVSTTTTTTDSSPCDARYPLLSLRGILDAKLLHKLMDLEQAASLQNADICGIEKCGFCEYMEIYPDIDGEKGEATFKCRRKECQRITCRVCRLEAHPYLTCAQVQAINASKARDAAAKKGKEDAATAARKLIEESMSSALIRECPNAACKTPMLKESGCNKLTCPRCARLLCYLCGQDVTETKYEHWAEAGPCKGRVYDIRDEAGDVERGRVKGVQEVVGWGEKR